MKPYIKMDVAEQQLEDLVRRHVDVIEEGLVYVDHQCKTTGGRLDVLMVDSGQSLVVAELKIVQDEVVIEEAVVAGVASPVLVPIILVWIVV